MMTKKEFYKEITKRVRDDMAKVTSARTEIEKLEKEINSRMFTAEAISIKRSRISELKHNINRIQDSIKWDVKKKTEAFRKEIDDNDVIKYSELTDDAKLLTMNLPLNEKDLKQIIERNSNNRTMIKLVMRYAEERKIHLPIEYVPAVAEVSDADTLAYAAEVCVRHSDLTVYNNVMGEGSELESAFND